MAMHAPREESAYVGLIDPEHKRPDAFLTVSQIQRLEYWPTYSANGGSMSPKMRFITRLLLFSFIIQAIFPFGYSPQPGDIFIQSAFALSNGKSFKVSSGQAAKLSYEAATLELEAGSVSKDTTITITPLDEPDLPLLDQGMADVTLGPRRGYRFYPHKMHFNKKITIKLPYDPTLIPAGLTEQDIKTFYFDDQSGYWQELERVSVDTKSKVVVSLSDHFTDMINATVTVPDHSQPLSNNPTALKDIKAADPGAGINLIEPPQANNMGDARLSYPIQLPAGRNGMQPQLGLSYSSGGDNGWLGQGWDVPVSAIAIDMRWGVPRYDFDANPANPSYETETYLLDGEQLTPVAHRGPLQLRTAEKQFYARVEGDFNKIIRHGDRPTNYWWEVVDKEGKRFFYGGEPANGLDAASVLADPGARPNVFRWMLREVRDPNGNTIRYHYDVVHGGAGGEPWRQIYLRSIRYTGADGSDGPYEVLFNREGGRPDVIVDGQPGFKTVLSDRLTSIDVRLVTEAAPLVRRYRLEYVAGAFSKSLLSRVIQYGEDGTTEFNRHTFEYFDEVTTDPAKPTVLSGFRETPGFGGATTVDGGGLLFDQESTAFGGVGGGTDQTHFYGGITYSGYRKEFSAGAKVGQEVSDSTTLLTLLDLNGDGLLDQVFQSGNAVYFRANTGGPQSAPNFAPNTVKIQSLSELGSEASTTFTLGAETYVQGASIFVDKSFTRNRGDSYLSDVNGDGLVDFVMNGAVYFNTLVNGVPTFGSTSPTPLTPGANSDTSGMVQNPEAGKAEMEAEYHLVDPLRRWVAPYTGKVAITGPYRLLSAPPASYTTADGVRLSIQHNQAEIWSRTIANPADTSAKNILGLDAVDVTAGDRLYFRVNSINDGSYDAVEFNPTITYMQMDTARVDENNQPQFIYNAATDFAFGGRELPLTMPFNGTVTLAGTLEKSAITSDDVTLVVLKNGATVHLQTIPWDATGAFAVNVPLTTAANETLVVYLAADSRVDLSKVRFVADPAYNVPGKGPSPVCVAYNTIDGQPAPLDQNGKPVLVFTPPVTAQVYPRNASTTPYAPHKVVLGEGGGGPDTCEDGIDNDNNTLTDLDDPTCHRTMRVSWPVTADLFSDVLVGGDTTTLNYNMTLSVKRPAARLAKQRVDVRDGAIVSSAALEAKFQVASGDDLFFVIDAAATDSSTLAFNQLSLVSPQVILENPYGTEGQAGAGSCGDGIDNDDDGLTDVDDPECQSLPSTAPVDVHMGLTAHEAFAGGFRGWGYGQYNGQQSPEPVDETRLRLPLDENDDASDYFVPMVPFLDENHWRAQDEETWIGGGQMSASRLMVNYLDFPTGAAFGGNRGVIRYGGGENFVAGGGYNFSVLSFGAGRTEGANWSDIDFLDFNGDQYPDVVGGGEVQTTLPNGALDAERIPVGGFGRVRESESVDNNVNLGATMSRKISDARGRVKGATTEQSAYNLSANLGLTGNQGTSTAGWDLVDINGDGLPDYVRKPNPLAGETDLVVRLNLGYRFGAEEPWAHGSILRVQKSLSTGLSTGLGVTLPAYSYGGGFGHTLSLAVAETDLVDVNGDGLVDLVSKDVHTITTTPGVLESPSTALSVRFNTGNGFTAETYTFNGAMPRPINSNATVSRNLGLHFTIPIPIPFTPVAIIINPGYYHSNNLGGFEVMLSDLDGDGYADHIYSDTSGNVQVNLNKHGRTNLLKTVYRPLGAEIELDYARSGNTTDQPGNRWVLSRVDTFDGHAGDGDVVVSPGVAVTHVTTITYAGGKYDRAERDFYGFRTVTTGQLDPGHSNALYRSVVSTYKNDTFYNKGLLESEVTKDAAGNKFTEQINTYNVVTVVAGRGGALEDYTATRFPQLVRTDHRFYEGQATAGKSTFQTFGYDALGNITQYFEAGDAGAQDDVAATITYFSCPATYVVGKAQGIVVTANGTELRRRDSSMDCATGNVTQVRQYLANGTFAQTDLGYFPNGNLQLVTGPANSTNQRYQVGYQYDPVVQTYITTITDTFGYASSATYNFKYGNVATTTDTNNNVTSYTFDQFGRTETIKGPYEQAGTLPTIRFEYHPNDAPAWALTKNLDPYRDPTGADTINTVLFTDGLKRVLQTKKDGTIFTGRTSAAQHVMLVSGRVTFDFVGRTVEEFYPVTEPLGTPGVFNPTEDGVKPTRMTYDILDRTTRTMLPDNTFSTTAYGFGPDRSGVTQFQITATDANGVQQKTYKDVRELVTSIQEFHTPPGGPMQSIWTSYSYDPLKQLVEVKDDHNNLTRVSYDNLGRRTSIVSPDTGRTDLEYDLASNLTAKITANLRAAGRRVTYTYDINRLTNITYPDFPSNNVRYSYGAPGASGNRAGRITRVEDESGSEDRFYGKLGEVTREVKSVASDSGPTMDVYATTYTYDTWGRMQNMTYPDGEVLTYRYDSGGQPRQVSGARGRFTYAYVDRMEYDKFGQRAFIAQGNGTETLYTYRPDNRRLANLQAGPAQGTLFQNLNYAYDPVGNVLSLANDVPVPAPSQFGGPTNQTFTYDDLYRLTNAAGTYQFAPDKTRVYSMNMQYDSIDNIVAKQQADTVLQPPQQPIPQQKTTYSFAYVYTAAHPHAPTHIGDRTFTYDANGNQSGWTDDGTGQRRTIVWDEENRMQSVSDNGHEETYKYNADGTRVIKRGPQGETVYVNPFFTVRNKAIGTKNVYVGNTRLVSKLARQSDQTEERDRYFYHPDHLGSSNYVTDASGQVYEHLEYFPFGETWVQESSNTQRTPYLFTAKELDEETGLYDYGARYYDPRTSVWQSADPLISGSPEKGIGNRPLLNAYAYSYNNPVKYNDPDGQEPKKDWTHDQKGIEQARKDLQAMWAAQPPPSSADVARSNAELAAAKRGPGWPYGKRDITPTEAQKLVDVAKLLATKQVPYGLHGRASDFQEADCTGAVGLMFDLAGKKYEGVWSTQWLAGEKDFHANFRKVDIEHGEQLQKGDVIVWYSHIGLYDPDAGPDGGNMWNAIDFRTPFGVRNWQAIDNLKKTSDGKNYRMGVYRYQVRGKP